MPECPQLAALSQHPGYKALKEKKPIQIIQITNMDVTGPADFSPNAIEERRARGYNAADEAQ